MSTVSSTALLNSHRLKPTDSFMKSVQLTFALSLFLLPYYSVFAHILIIIIFNDCMKAIFLTLLICLPPIIMLSKS